MIGSSPIGQLERNVERGMMFPLVPRRGICYVPSPQILQVKYENLLGTP